MNEAVSQAINFIIAILDQIPSSPFMFLIGLAIVLIIIRNIYSIVLGGV